MGLAPALASPGIGMHPLPVSECELRPSPCQSVSDFPCRTYAGQSESMPGNGCPTSPRQWTFHGGASDPGTSGSCWASSRGAVHPLTTEHRTAAPAANERQPGARGSLGCRGYRRFQLSNPSSPSTRSVIGTNRASIAVLRSTPSHASHRWRCSASGSRNPQRTGHPRAAKAVNTLLTCGTGNRYQ